MQYKSSKVFVMSTTQTLEQDVRHSSNRNRRCESKAGATYIGGNNSVRFTSTRYGVNKPSIDLEFRPIRAFISVINMASTRNPRRKRHHSEDGTPQPEKKQCRREPEAKLLTQNDRYSVTQPSEESITELTSGNTNELCASVGKAAEKGLLVVNVINGKITYWDDVDRRRKAAEGSCGALLSRESITGLEAAGPGGFVLTFSSGRTAQLVLTDAQSRPAITITYLRGRSSNGGFFGGLKNVLGGSGILKSIAAVRHRPLNLRDKAQILLGNEDAMFQIWQLSWQGQPVSLRDVDAHKAVVDAISAARHSQNPVQNVTLLDFVIASETTEGPDLLLLVNFVVSGQSMYALVEVDIDKESATTRRVILLHSYLESSMTTGAWKPHLCLPKPGHTAFAVFENAVTIVTLAADDASPEAQLLRDAGQVPEPFQDTVEFRAGGSYQACGMFAGDMDTMRRSASVLVRIKNFGLLRVIAEEPVGDGPTKQTQAVSLKNKIEQAVFFGSMSSNPLNLMRKTDGALDVEKLEEAALAVSHEILISQSRLVPQVATSMLDHLQKRGENLRNLAAYVFSLSSDISRNTRWQLRCDAEQIFACRKVWTIYDDLLRSDSGGRRILPEALIAMNPKEKSKMNRERGESDRLRHWCSRDTYRMHVLFEWILAIPHLLQQSGIASDPEDYMHVLNEANVTVLEGLDAGYDFRLQEAQFYGLENENFRKTILLDKYEGT